LKSLKDKKLEEFVMTRYDWIKRILNNMNTAEIVEIHNQYCESADCMEKYIYSMDEFNEVMENTSPWQIVSMCFSGYKFSPEHDYFCFNDDGDLESFDSAPSKNSGISINDIAGYIDKTEDSLNNEEIQELFNPRNFCDEID